MGAGTVVSDEPRPAVVDGLRRLARTELRLRALEAALDRELDAVRARYAERVDGLRDRIGRMRGDLEERCRAARDVIFPAGRKSLSTPYGEVGFRRAAPVLSVRDGLDDDEVCRLLRAERLGRLVRVRREPDRLAARKALEEGRVTAERLARCGLVLREREDRFHCKVRRDAPADAGRRVG